MPPQKPASRRLARVAASRTDVDISLLAAALLHAQRGDRVFPVHTVRAGRCGCGDAACGSAGKHPIGALVPRGFKDATTDAATICGWWRRVPVANVGVVAGVVADVDPRHGGDRTLDDLTARHGTLPETVETITGGDGRHLRFARPGGFVPSRSNALGPGIDVKADGGYVLVPPSLHQSGQRYRWAPGRSPTDLTPAAMPDWMLMMVRDVPRPRAAC
jgi:hypothetical protein